MTRFALAALCCLMVTGACSRATAPMGDAPVAGYARAEAPTLVPLQPIGTRAQNDDLRFSILKME